MKLIIQSFILLLILAYMAEIKITLSPFSISFGRGWLAMGFILIMCGCLCLKAQWYEEGKQEFDRKLKESIKQIQEEKIKEKI